MDYSNYSVEDFVNDQHFIEWVRNPDPLLDSYWHVWITQHPEKSPLVEHARELVLFLSFDVIQPSKEEQQEVKTTIRQLIQSRTNEWNSKKPMADQKSAIAVSISVIKNKPLSFWRPYYKVASLFTGFILFAGILFFIRIFNTETVYATGYGQTKNIELPDGSIVMINANSTLHYANDWQQTHRREVWLRGEAFFNVRRKPEWQHAKFIVHTDELDVEVLGTSFNVNNRRGVVKVVLNSGKVLLNQTDNHQRNFVMKPKDLVEFAQRNKSFMKRVVEPEVYTSWRHHKLIFKQTPVKDIAQVLEDNYGMKVIFKDTQLEHRKFTGSVPNSNVDLFLSVFAESMNIHITKDKQTIIMQNN